MAMKFPTTRQVGGTLGGVKYYDIEAAAAAVDGSVVYVPLGRLWNGVAQNLDAANGLLVQLTLDTPEMIAAATARWSTLKTVAAATAAELLADQQFNGVTALRFSGVGGVVNAVLSIGLTRQD